MPELVTGHIWVRADKRKSLRAVLTGRQLWMVISTRRKQTGTRIQLGVGKEVRALLQLPGEAPAELMAQWGSERQKIPRKCSQATGTDTRLWGGRINRLHILHQRVQRRDLFASTDFPLSQWPNFHTSGPCGPWLCNSPTLCPSFL